MLNFSKYLTEFARDLDGKPEISQAELKLIEDELDSIFRKLKIDIAFTNHFKDRLNDKRNKKQITIDELIGVYISLLNKHGKAISKISGSTDVSGIIKSINTNINIPVELKYDKNKKQVVVIATTILRKRGFKSNSKSTDKILTVEGT